MIPNLQTVKIVYLEELVLCLAHNEHSSLLSSCPFDGPSKSSITGVPEVGEIAGNAVDC